jgi:hypothetical protein
MHPISHSLSGFHSFYLTLVFHHEPWVWSFFLWFHLGLFSFNHRKYSRKKASAVAEKMLFDCCTFLIRRRLAEREAEGNVGE